MHTRSFISTLLGVRRAVRVLVVAAMAYSSACTVLGPEIAEVPAPIPEEAAPPSPEPPQVEPASDSPALAEPAPPTPAPLPAVLMVTSGKAASYAQVADALATQLSDRYELHRMTLPTTPDAASLSTLEERTWQATIAVGIDAAEMLSKDLDTPMVFCQIFDYGPLLDARPAVYGVEALPPLGLQLTAWKQLAPDVKSIGMIVRKEQPQLVSDAKHAASQAGLELHIEYAASDRELLYRFKRLAPSLDGILLLPDNDILSPSVLKEIFGYAPKHGVHTIVFNRSLLNWGALLSVGSDPSNVAEQVAAVLDAVTSGSTDDLPRVTPLSAVRIELNESLASDLGLMPPPSGSSRLEAAVH